MIAHTAIVFSISHLILVNRDSLMERNSLTKVTTVPKFNTYGIKTEGLHAKWAFLQ
jgi:hypothetical protein